MARTKEYCAWSNMKNRCSNEKYCLFHRYGGRGIKVCDRWINSFANFLSDMGLAPTKEHSLDRVDNDLGYSPNNCRWATNEEQGNNTSSNKVVNYKGLSYTLANLCKEYGLDYSMTQRRLDLGWSVDNAVEKPKGHNFTTYRTPEGDFDDQYKVAEFYGIKIKTVSARFCSKTMKDWVKISTK